MAELVILPDPDHPAGGYARVRAPGLPVTQPGGIVLRDLYTDRFLGPEGWQSGRVAIADVTTGHDGNGAYLLLGPGVVRHMMEFQPVQLELGAHAAEGTWPSNVLPPKRDASGAGGIYAGRPAPVLKSAQAQKERPVITAVREVPQEAPVAQVPRRWWPWALAAAVVVLAAGGGVLWYLRSPAPKPAPVPAPEVVAGPECAPERLLAAGRDFAGRLEDLRRCPDADAQTGMTILAQGEAAQAPGALFALGALYDPQVTDPVFETQMKMTIDDRPDIAAAYYDKAVRAGSEAAKAPLAAVCAEIKDRDDPLSQIAQRDHCGGGN